MAAIELSLANREFFKAFEAYKLFKNSYPDIVSPGFIRCSKCGLAFASR